VRIAVVVGLVAVAALLGWYLSFSASRLDRLHHRVEGSRAALDAQLVRRAEAAVELATSGLLDPSSALLVAGAAADALSAGERDVVAPLAGDGVDRETAESDLSQAVRLALDAREVGLDPTSGHHSAVLDRLGSATHRVQLARRFHNQAVLDARRVRRKRVVRWARLAGHAAMPRTVEIDDEPPAALAR
jgi:hypothetical protein